MLLLGTALYESGGLTYVKQLRGPAWGFYQMEPFTYFDTLERVKYLSIFPKLSRMASDYDRSHPNSCAYNHYWATAMARIFYYLVPSPLPGHKDISGLAEYYKIYWNTKKGKGTIEGWKESYNKYLDTSY